VLGPAADPDRACERLAEQFGLGPGAIGAVAAANPSADEAALWAACREAAGRPLDGLAERVEPRFGWDDIVLPAGIADELQAVAAQVRHRAAVYGRGGFGRRLVRGRGVTALFAGPSGTGKTMAAEIIARDLRLDLCRIDLSGVVSKYIGETEKNLKRLFEAAEGGGAVLFFDEADALFGKRSEVKDSHDRYANIEISYLLQRMEAYSGLAVLATNMKTHLDPAFLRRLRFVIDFPFPDVEQRRGIWARAFPPETETDGLDLSALARLEVAGGNIAVIAVNAAFLAAAEGTPVRMAHLARAARAEFRKLDKEFRPSWSEAR
jgi:SpoVK/Ycf46/Vps4 family AAA+-type ATPase